uniref:Ig-like domain-containing protein n=1 Tax=Oreochromis niloticus TaxID=8128 RepID=I3JNH9_ORENI
FGKGSWWGHPLYLYFLSLTFTSLLFPLSDKINITAESGQNITLPCRAHNNQKPIIVVEWIRSDLGAGYALLFQDGHFVPDDQHPSFKNRVDLQDRQMKDGDVSLILNNLTPADSGTYECHVFTQGANQRERATEHTSTIELKIIPLSELLQLFFNQKTSCFLVRNLASWQQK